MRPDSPGDGILGAEHIGHEPEDAGVAVGPRFQRSRAEAAVEFRRQHADTRLLDDIPDAHNGCLLGHVTGPHRL